MAWVPHEPSAVMAGRDPAIHSMFRRVGGIEWAPGSSPGVTRWGGETWGDWGSVVGGWTGWGRARGTVRAVDSGVRRYDTGGEASIGDRLAPTRALLRTFGPKRRYPPRKGGG